MKPNSVLALMFALALSSFALADSYPLSLTPPPPQQPRVNGPDVFGVRPGSPFLYTIPATGARPMRFEADGLPPGLSLDAATGRITGVLNVKGEHPVVLRARNALGEATKDSESLQGKRSR